VLNIQRFTRVTAIYTSAYVSIRQHTSAYVSISQHTSAHVSIRQRTSAYVSIRQHMSEGKRFVGLNIQRFTRITAMHTSAYVSIRQNIQRVTRITASRLKSTMRGLQLLTYADVC
jgi:hypothetical protein